MHSAGKLTLSEADTAWIAGVVEGEGCIKTLRSNSAELRVSMTDEDVIRRLHAVSGMGRVSGPYVRGAYKPSWLWVVSRVAHLDPLLRALHPWLGDRRSSAADVALEHMVGNLGDRAQRTHCRKGHPYVQRYAEGCRRICRECRNAKTRERYAERQHTTTS